MHELPQVTLINSLLGCALRLFTLVYTGALLVSNPMLTVCVLNSSTNIVSIIPYFLL